MVWCALVQLELFDLSDVCAPSSKSNVGDIGQRWESPELVVQPEIIFEFQCICEETMWSPGDSPLGCHGGTGCQGLMHYGVVDRVAVQQSGIRCKNLPMELGAKDRALELLRVVVPVANQDEFPSCGKESQDAGQNLGICGSLDGLIGFEVNCDHQDGAGLCLPEEGLVPAAFNVKGFQLGEAVCSVMDDHDASMGALIVAIGMGWVSKSMSASDFKVLTHGLVLLPIQVSLNHDVDFIISCPVPIKGALAKGCDVADMEAHVLLGASGFLGRCAVERWIVVWSFRRRQCQCCLPWCDQCRGLDAPDLDYLARNLGRQKGQDLGCGSIVRNPHEVFVHQNGVVVPGLVGRASVAYVCHWDVLGAGSGESVQ